VRFSCGRMLTSVVKAAESIFINWRKARGKFLPVVALPRFATACVLGIWMARLLIPQGEFNPLFEQTMRRRFEPYGSDILDSFALARELNDGKRCRRFFDVNGDGVWRRRTWLRSEHLKGQPVLNSILLRAGRAVTRHKGPSRLTLYSRHAPLAAISWNFSYKCCHEDCRHEASAPAFPRCALLHPESMRRSALSWRIQHG